MSVAGAAVSLCSLDVRLLLPTLAFAWLSRALIQLDPGGTTLVCTLIHGAATPSVMPPKAPPLAEVTSLASRRSPASTSTGRWYCHMPGIAGLWPCEVSAQGKLSAVLWLNCTLNSTDGHNSDEHSPDENGPDENGPDENGPEANHPDAKGRRVHRSFLVFDDALSDEHWRLMRRQLRLEAQVRP
ncbi:MAG: hypothetical protein NWP69_10680 [Congregibacter sp.]|nr:hypothetical protein [Congregibacter sp.]